ncbi:hypothetical protein [Paracoccus sp. PAMC 22219]|uniref:hypothetical protein n=1 Tax=Paracoccus sp. PAMC 22219 TaxID=1569209 RepID=UPI000696A86A|nr:hypothetical protein [Paracoccus sp. PAMC 22219]
MTIKFVLVLLAALPLAACMEDVGDDVAVIGGDLTGPAATACRAAIAAQVGKSQSDVAVFDVAESEAGIGVQATVAGAEAPWACQTDAAFRVQGVMYTGSEGAL